MKKQNLNEINTFGFPTGSVDSGKVVTGGEGGNWGGSLERTLEVANIAKACSGKSNIITSQKRSRVKTASGNVSDHYKGNLSAYAVDLSAKGEKGDELLACIMKKWNGGSNSSYKGGKWLNVNVGNYRYQFGWKVKDHYDHIHVGVKKRDGKVVDTPDDEQEVDLGGVIGGLSDTSSGSSENKGIDLISIFKTVGQLMSKDKGVTDIKEDINRMKDIMKKIL